MAGTKSTAKTIAASRALQKRVGTGEIDEHIVKKAQALMDENTVDFAPLARPYLDDLTKALAAAHSVQGTLDAQTRESLAVPIMNLKANATTFNYQLIGNLTGTVLTFLESHNKPGKKTLQVVELLNKTIRLLVARQMKGQGGSTGAALQSAFDDLCRWCARKEK